jgi:hypothetical protein
MKKMNWYEVWADDGLGIPYLLLVQFDANTNLYSVVDPSAGNKIVFESNEYETVRDWLLEDEYQSVNGRMASG